MLARGEGMREGGEEREREREEKEWHRVGRALDGGEGVMDEEW